ncbi:hypothetical protein VTH82DRAFT_241 [Thermothelomyces myriococcoides]
MPLHLLGKKSWNVYSPANIARVRRDEAEARAREEAQEKRMQEIDSARRLAILRGEVPPPLEDAEPSPPSQRGDSGRGGDRDGYSGRKRKRRGEDDTDFEMRLARERVAAGDRAARELAAPTSLVDSKGHLTLFEPPPEPSTRGGSGGKDDEAARRDLEDKDQYQMRFVNAAGRDGQGLTDGGPWYASREGASSTTPVPRKNVFGQEDPGRKEREAARLDASDPLALMKQGAKMTETAIPPGGSGHIGIVMMNTGNEINIAAANAREILGMRKTGLTDEETPTKTTGTDTEMAVGSGVGGRKERMGVNDSITGTTTEHAGLADKRNTKGIQASTRPSSDEAK